MTIKQAKGILRPLGVTLVSKPHTGEFRVNFLGGSEATACYETDLDGAVSTGKAMAEWRRAQTERQILCHACGAMRPVDQSCGCFDNGGE